MRPCVLRRQLPPRRGAGLGGNPMAVVSAVAAWLEPHLQPTDRRLLAALQSGEPDVDFGLYASRLRGLLETKVATAQALLERVAAFQQHLAIEEQVSAKLDASAANHQRLAEQAQNMKAPAVAAKRPSARR